MLEIDGLQVEPIIGLEIHVHLATATKMWCGCAVEYGAEPNSRTCPVCLGLPGSLPIPNQCAVELTILTGLALNCTIPRFTKWDRKSYYYPDLPKNYQISQYDLPLCENGYFEVPFTHDGHKIRKIGIIRAHLEEDAGKNVHDFADCTAVDLNRAGTPLLEIVTEPDLHCADETREFAVQLQRLVRYLGVSDADMQKGQMRFEPNINVKITKDDEEYRTPIVEVKNLNSFKSLHGAVAFEIRRQIEAWQEDGVTAESGNKSNRGWDDDREVTVPQREKEEAHDYRYFPDPDLPPVIPDAAWIADQREHMPELPIPRTERFVAEYKLPPKDAPALVDDRATADLLDHAAEAGGDKLTLGKQFLSFWSKNANERGVAIAGLGLEPMAYAELANMTAGGKINATAAVQIAETLLARGVDSGATPAALAEELGLLQSTDTGEMLAWVEAAIAANEQAVQDAVANPKKQKRARGFLTGQVMKLSGGKADPKVIGDLIDQKLAELGAG